DGLVVFQPWPELDESLLRRPQVTMVVQVDGRLRDRIEMPAGADQAGAQERALQSANVQRALGGRRLARAVYVPDRLINLVTE
ncbi:MAG: leucine--tRNA ligase, partial [Candidatus Dormibacteraeota bacterium]|nr:leucine--tRNA ligase [Candidatus Dormibacteraeota bacterium]